jgi:threonine dehydratase
MTLTAKRIEGLARELAGCNERDVAETIQQYAAENRIAIRDAGALALPEASADGQTSTS